MGGEGKGRGGMGREGREWDTQEKSWLRACINNRHIYIVRVLLPDDVCNVANTSSPGLYSWGEFGV